MEKQTCVICKEEFVGFGNNPEPVKSFVEGKCTEGSHDNWWNYDKFLSPIMNENMENFIERVDLSKSMLSALPECRKIARKEFFDDEALCYIVEYCRVSDNQECLDYNMLGRFMYEETERIISDIIIKKIKEFIAKSSDSIKDSEIAEHLKECLWSLSGGTCVHFVTNGLKVFKVHG